MIRSFFFIRDSLTKQFYSSSRNDLGTFAEAVVFLQRKNAEKGIRDRFFHWEIYLERTDTKKGNPVSEYIRRNFIEAKKRQELKNWGMEVVEVKVNEPA